jgi:GTP-binding protein
MSDRAAKPNRKARQLTGFRASGKDEGSRLTPPRRMSLEQAIAYIQDDELVEVTPKAIRIRKRFLDPRAQARGAQDRGRIAALLLEKIPWTG